jgi:hypothetical protein
MDAETIVPDGLEPRWSYLLAAGILLVITLIAHAALLASQTKEERQGRLRGMWPLIIGVDGRGSTSKLQFVLWTYAVAFVFLALLLQGLGEDIDDGFTEQYLFLLGIPIVGAVGAKAITTSKMEAHTLDKPAEPEPRGALKQTGSVVTEVVSDDDGHADVGDFQYFVFNLIALAYFFHDLFESGQDTLPEIPDTLVALTGVSAFAYLTKKGVIRDVPVLSAIIPTTIKANLAGQKLRVRGYNLVRSAARGAAPHERVEGLCVMVGGHEATTVPAESQLGHDPVELVVVVPSDLAVGEHPVVVLTAWGAQTEPLLVTAT